MTVPPLALPEWAEVSERRRAHIARVTSLLDHWAHELSLEPEEAQAWHDAGRWHDALRDASELTLRSLTSDVGMPTAVLHGPAAAIRLERDGEHRDSVLNAIRWHTLGNPEWDRTGRALYMADFLEPGRAFAQTDRTFLATHLVHDFDGVFRQVVRMRLEWTLREGKVLFPEAVTLWNSIR